MRQEAEQLVADGAVVNLDPTDGQVDADVMMDEKAVHVRWVHGADGWSGFTDYDETSGDSEEMHDLGLCSVLVALHKSHFQADPFSKVAAEPFQITVEKKLGRALSMDEAGYIAKIEKRLQRAQLVGQIFDHDMVRLHPKWSIQSIEPLALWPSKPRTTQEFWNYIALALDDKGLTFPAFMRPVTDLDGTRERLREWRQARTVPQWVERIRKFASAPAASRVQRPCDFRLIITTSEARLQMREGDGAFQNVSGQHLESLKKAHARGAFTMDSHAELLLLACFCQIEESAPDSHRLDVEKNAAWLNSLLHQPQLHSRLLTLDEQPFEHPAEPLVWRAEERTAHGTLQLRLVTASSQEAPSPLRVLPGAETLYLGPESVFRGPVWFGEDTRAEQSVQIPLQALTSADGVVFLEKLDVELPETLKKKVRREDLNIEVKARCLAAHGQAGADHLILNVRAADRSGISREMLRDGGWQRVAALPNAAAEDIIVCYDRAPLANVTGILDAMRPVWDADQGGFRVRMTKNFPDQFQLWARTLPQGVTLETDDRLQTILADPLIARVKLEAAQTENIDWFDLKLIFEIEGEDLSPADIRRLVAAKGGFVQLADGTWRRVQIELTDEQREIIEKLGIDFDEYSDEAHRVHMRHLAAQKAGEFINPKAWAQIAARLSEAELGLRPDVSPELRITLRPYQVEGYHFLAYLSANRIGGILADDMGLGKTVQSIAWILWLRESITPQANGDTNDHTRPAPTLVVCPKSVLDVWATEFGKAAPHLRVQVLHDKDELKMDGLSENIDVLVLNYAQLRGCIEALSAVAWLAVILDEGQQIKNPDSKAAKAARRLRAQNRLVLTGTPLENRLLDLWSLMTFATPGALGDRAYFQRHFDRRKDERAPERLSARLRPFLIRRTKGQVAKELPPRTEEAMLCEMSGTQERLYRDELARAQMMVMAASSFDAITKQRFAILQALTRLRQICCHPSLVDASAAAEESAKLTATLELIEGLHAEGHKVLLFSQFVRMLTIIRGKLEEANIPYHWLTGASMNRADIVRGFQEDTNASVFLLSLKAGGSGLNLTAASYVILYDPWWNPAVEAQAIDRAHRIGQTQPVMAYRMLTRNTIEEKILMLQQKKQMMSSSILGEEGFARGLDRTDFEFLFDLEPQEEEKKNRSPNSEWVRTV
jgi:superfamily II DNA or RNA helicase